MKGIVIFDTSYGNTRIVGETIAQTLKEYGNEVDTFYVKEIKRLNTKDYDFLVLGSPTKFGTMSFTVKGFLNKIKSQDWMNKPFATFDTENPENVEQKQGSAAEKIAEKLLEKQMRQVLPALKALVNDWKGPLIEGEIERSREYTKQLANKLTEVKN